MKKLNVITCGALVFFLMSFQYAFAQNPENWTNKELVKPSDLANTLKANESLPTIFSVGPGAVIPHSIEIGMVNDEKNLANFREQLSKLPKSANIIVYCGCCPFEHCPNVRPAIAQLHQLKFKNYQLLNLPHNLKSDWIDKGYPTTKL